MELKFLLATGIVGLAVVVPGRGDTFGNGANTFTINFSAVGNPGNGVDAGAGGGTSFGSFGAVSYGFRMGVTEVAAGWIVNASNVDAPLQKLTGVTTAPWTGNQPGAGVTWFEAAAFVNWLNTSTGHQAAYNLNSGATALTPWDPSEAWQLGGQNLFRHKNAYYFLPSENEWYKAAYHKNDGTTVNYWDYPTASNSAPAAVVNGTSGAVYGTPPGATGPADVDFSGGLSAYGTRGQGGNLKEWMETAFDGVNDLGSEGRTTRGGAVQDDASFLISGGNRVLSDPAVGDTFIGFRVASVPEPSAGVLMLTGAIAFFQRRRSRMSR